MQEIFIAAYGKKNFFNFSLAIFLWVLYNTISKAV